MALVQYTFGSAFDPANSTTVALDPTVYTGPSDSYSVYLAHPQLHIVDNDTGLEQVVTYGPPVPLAFNLDFSDNQARVTLQGYDYDDILTGGGAIDVLEGGAGGDQLIGGAGDDWASYEHSTSFVWVVLDPAGAAFQFGDALGDTFSSIENIRGSAFNDIFEGDAGDNVFEGGAGADWFDGHGGFNTVAYLYSSAAVTVNLLTLSASGGDAEGDTNFANIQGIWGSMFDDSLTGNDGHNIIDGSGSGPAGDSLFGMGGDDTLKLRANPAMVDGGADKDTIVMRAGATITLSDANCVGIEKVFVQNGGALDMSGVTTKVYIRSDSTVGESVSITGTQDRDVYLAGAGSDTFHFNEAGFNREWVFGVDLANDSFDFSGLATDVSDLIIKSINDDADTEITIVGHDRADAVVLKDMDAASVIANGHFLF